MVHVKMSPRIHGFYEDIMTEMFVLVGTSKNSAKEENQWFNYCFKAPTELICPGWAVAKQEDDVRSPFDIFVRKPIILCGYFINSIFQIHIGC